MMKDVKTLETIKSMCPECRTVIDASIIEEGSSVYMYKSCPVHGDYKILISRYAWFYKGLNSLYEMLFPDGHVLKDTNIRNIQFHPTSRCNLQCPVCYSNKRTLEQREEDSVETIKSLLKRINGTKWVGILGGEPTEREDLPEILRAFAEAGHQVALYTNGLKLQDENYVRMLKRFGVQQVILGVDSLSDDAVYVKMRGQKLLQIKQQVLRNLKDQRIKTELLTVVVRNVNEKYIKEVLDFCLKNRFVTSLNLRGYSHIGRRHFAKDNEFVMDELVELLQDRSYGLVTLEEFYMFQRLGYLSKFLSKSGPQCYVKQAIYLPRGRHKKVRDIFPPDKFNHYLDEFQRIYPEAPLKAKRIIRHRVMSHIIKAPVFLAQWIMGGRIPGFYRRDYISLEVAMFYTPYTIDLTKTKSRCSDVWLSSYSTSQPIDYCTFLCREF